MQVPGPRTRFVARDRGWLAADLALARLCLRYRDPAGNPPTVAFASRNRVLNTNAVGLAAALHLGRAISFAQLLADDGDTVAAYQRFLSDPAHGLPRMLVSMDRNTEDIPPLVTQAYAEAAARRLRFKLIKSLRLPDGRHAHVWFQAG